LTALLFLKVALLSRQPNKFDYALSFLAYYFCCSKATRDQILHSLCLGHLTLHSYPSSFFFFFVRRTRSNHYALIISRPIAWSAKTRWFPSFFLPRCCSPLPLHIFSLLSAVLPRKALLKVHASPSPRRPSLLNAPPCVTRTLLPYTA